MDSASSPFFLGFEGKEASEAVITDTQSFRAGGGHASEMGAASFIATVRRIYV